MHGHSLCGVWSNGQRWWFCMIRSPGDIRAILGCVSKLYDVCIMTKVWIYFSDHIRVVRVQACIFPEFHLKYSRFVGQPCLKLLGSSDRPVPGSQEWGLEVHATAEMNKAVGMCSVQSRWFSLLNKKRSLLTPSSVLT